ncbi:hypothetical protein NC653_034499 [Populus alba x Populus x berolinensis]|uniref:DUF4283 domain-containing protein n=1 Tax=Populus alba x Populus x berolinensis TaxID=444605 RepID=A0AAD6PX65_9ROSI|nr:hypothetical protein NC653_034499 [Populus alba x Populus x berolinensis]
MNMEFFIAVPRIDLIPMKPFDIVNGIEISPSTLHVKIFYRDKVFGIRSPPLMRIKVNLIKNKLVKSRLRGVWKQSGDFELMDVNNGFFAVKFDIKDHITKVITRGSWMIFDHYLAVCTWSSDFNLVTTKINQTMVWQRILSLKLVFYDESFLLVMLIIVSTLVKVDLNTFNVEREKSAWVC